MFVLLRSSSGRINFLFIVFRLEYTVIKRPGGIRSQMPGNQSSLCILCLYINISFIHYFLFIILFLFFVLFCETHIFMATFLFTLHSYFCFIFNQYPPILLMFTNIISFSFLLHPTHPSSVFRLAIPCNCSEDKSQRPCCRNAIFCYSERYAQNFIGYSGITVVGNWIRKMAHDKFADVSRCLDLCAPHFPEKATLGICHGNGSKA